MSRTGLQFFFFMVIHPCWSWDFTRLFKEAVRMHACGLWRILDGFCHLLGVHKLVSRSREEKTLSKLPVTRWRDWGRLPVPGPLCVLSAPLSLFPERTHFGRVGWLPGLHTKACFVVVYLSGMCNLRLGSLKCSQLWEVPPWGLGPPLRVP